MLHTFSLYRIIHSAEVPILFWLLELNKLNQVNLYFPSVRNLPIDAFVEEGFVVVDTDGLQDDGVQSLKDPSSIFILFSLSLQLYLSSFNLSVSVILI